MRTFSGIFSNMTSWFCIKAMVRACTSGVSSISADGFWACRARARRRGEKGGRESGKGKKEAGKCVRGARWVVTAARPPAPPPPPPLTYARGEKVGRKDGGNVRQRHFVHVALGHHLCEKLAQVPQDHGVAQRQPAHGALDLVHAACGVFSVRGCSGKKGRAQAVGEERFGQLAQVQFEQRRDGVHVLRLRQVWVGSCGEWGGGGKAGKENGTGKVWTVRRPNVHHSGRQDSDGHDRPDAKACRSSRMRTEPPGSRKMPTSSTPCWRSDVTHARTRLGTASQPLFCGGVRGGANQRGGLVG